MSQVHLHQHKRQHKGRETRAMVLFDRLVVVMGVINLFATLPQVLTIWTGKSAVGVSSLSWGYYSLFSLVLLTYGFLHKEKPIIATYMGSLVLFFAIFIGSVIY